MHGCPPDEIEAIARHLLVDRGLHTTVKLNPTLLGRDRVLEILHDRLGYHDIRIADAVFDHDLQYGRAVRLIRSLTATAHDRGLHFGVKLSNTLAMGNHRGVLPGQEMYMSGRALYPVTMALFHRLATELGAGLSVSFSAGADALNLPAILAAGARPVTVVSDLLKPGGYARFAQYLDNLEAEMARRGAASLAELSADRQRSLAAEAAAAAGDPRYARSTITGRPAQGRLRPRPLRLHRRALRGAVRHRPGRSRLRLAHRPRRSRAGAAHHPGPQPPAGLHRLRLHPPLRDALHPAQLRGAGGHSRPQALCRRTGRHGHRAPRRCAPARRWPSSAAGRRAWPPPACWPSTACPSPSWSRGTVRAGCWPAPSRPSACLPAALEADLQRIRALGVRFELNSPAPDPAALLAQGYAAVYVATGAPVSIPLGIPGEDGPGVYDALGLLDDVRRQVEEGSAPRSIGRRVLVVGGGNSAVDAARAALRLGAEKVTLVYRRTRREMPAIAEEAEAALGEGVILAELTIPVRVIRSTDGVVALECRRAVLGEPGPDGRRQPVPVEGSEFGMAADAIVVAIGQRPASPLPVDAASGVTAHPGIYAGGDAVRGPATVIQAIADGRRAAEAICRDLGLYARALAVPRPLPLRRRDRPPEGRPCPPRAAPRARRAPAGDAAPASRRWRSPWAVRPPAARPRAVCSAPRSATSAWRSAPTAPTTPTRPTRPRSPCRCWPAPAVPGRSGHGAFRVAQARQIVHVDDLCNACGNCETFCVHQGKPYRDKPRLFLTREGFAAASPALPSTWRARRPAGCCAAARTPARPRST